MICKVCNEEIRPSDECCPHCGTLPQWEGGNGFWDMAGKARPALEQIAPVKKPIEESAPPVKDITYASPIIRVLPIAVLMILLLAMVLARGSKIRSLEKKNQQLQHDRTTVTETLRSENDELLFENGELKKAIEELEKEKTKLESEKASLIESVEQLNSQIGNWKTPEEDTVTDEAEENEAQKPDVEDEGDRGAYMQIQKLEQENEQLKQQRTELETNLELIEAEIEKNAEEIQRLNEKIIVGMGKEKGDG